MDSTNKTSCSYIWWSFTNNKSDMADCTYPDLTQLKNKDAFRLATINTRLASLTDRIDRDREKLTKKRKRHKKLVGANVILTGIGVALSTAGGVLSGTGVGVMVGGPAIGLGAVCGLGALITLRLCKTSNHELYQQLVTLGQAKFPFSKNWLARPFLTRASQRSSLVR